MTSTVPTLVIKPRTGWHRIEFDELWSFRELFGFLIWRDIKVRYKQTFLGGLWAVLQPLIGSAIFGLLFTRLTPTHAGNSPYPLFVYTGLVSWTFFANAVGMSSNSLIGNEHLIRKTYFPRLLIPLASVSAFGLDLLVGYAFFAIFLCYYHWSVTIHILLLPVFVFGMFLAASGISLVLAALNVRYRDIKYVVPFFTQMAFFLTPVIYPAQSAPRAIKLILFTNPMAGMIEGTRYAILGEAPYYQVIWASFAVAVFLFGLGIYVFRRMECSFADVI